MAQYFPHEDLEVYDVALKFTALADELLSSWVSSWAVRDQLDRATESIIMNLAKAARIRESANVIYSIECSLGSVLECASCLDVAFRRDLVNTRSLRAAKEMLQRIACMEVRLRASWDTCVNEQCDSYTTNAKRYFLHESLEVYQRSLQVHESLGIIWKGDAIKSRYARKIDDFSTSLTVNIAEGNGRFSKLDHIRFLGAAEDAGTKLAACLDLVASAGVIDIDRVKIDLREVMAMLSGLRGYLQE